MCPAMRNSRKLIKTLALALSLALPPALRATTATESWQRQNADVATLIAQGKEVMPLLRDLTQSDLDALQPRLTVEMGNYLFTLAGQALVRSDRAGGGAVLVFCPVAAINVVDGGTLGLLSGGTYCLLSLDMGSVRRSPFTTSISAGDVQDFDDQHNKAQQYKIDDYADKLRDLMKQLEKGNQDKAADTRRNLLKRANKAAFGVNDQAVWLGNNPFIQCLEPAWLMAEALVQAGNGQLWAAASCVAQVQSDPSQVYRANKFLAPYGTSVEQIAAQVQRQLTSAMLPQASEALWDRLTALTAPGTREHATALQRREAAAWSAVSASNQRSECARYLAKYAGVNPQHEAQARDLQEQFDFDALERTLPACEAFLAQYPDSKHKQLVQEEIYTLAFNQATERGDAKSLHAYVDRYPQSPLVPEVKELLYTADYQELRANPTAAACRKYLADYPASPKVEQVKALEESCHYTEATEQNTVQALQGYLAEHGDNGYNANDVRRRLDVLEGRVHSVDANEESLRYGNEHDANTNEFHESQEYYDPELERAARRSATQQQEPKQPH